MVDEPEGLLHGVGERRLWIQPCHIGLTGEDEEAFSFRMCQAVVRASLERWLSTVFVMKASLRKNHVSEPLQPFMKYWWVFTPWTDGGWVSMVMHLYENLHHHCRSICIGRHRPIRGIGETRHFELSIHCQILQGFPQG